MNGQKKKTAASRYCHYVYVQRLRHTEQTAGNFVPVWDTSLCFPCSIDPIRADKRAELNTMNSWATHIVRTRAGIDIAENDRLFFQGRIFEKLTMENAGERDIELVITCTNKKS